MSQYSHIAIHLPPPCSAGNQAGIDYTQSHPLGTKGSPWEKKRAIPLRPAIRPEAPLATNPSVRRTQPPEGYSALSFLWDMGDLYLFLSPNFSRL